MPAYFLKQTFKLCCLGRRLIYFSAVLIFFISANFSILPAQQNDTLYNILHAPVSLANKTARLSKYAMDFAATNPDSAMQIAEKGLQLSRNLKNDTGIADCSMAIGWCYYGLGNRDSSEYFLLSAAKFYHNIKDRFSEGKCLLNLSFIYQDGEEYVKLLNCLKAARPLFEKTNDEMGLAQIDLTMGSTYGDMNLYEQGKQYIRLATSTVKRLNKVGFLSSCYSAYGYLLMQEKDYDSALIYYHMEYAVSKKIADAEGNAISTDNLGEAFLKKNNQQSCNLCVDSAFYYYRLALLGYTKLNSPGNIKYEEMNMGTVLRIQKQYKRSEKFLTNAFHYFDSSNNINYAYSAAEQLSNLYEETGNYKQAYNYNLITQKFKDSLDNKNRTDSIAKIFALYETERKDRTIQLLNTKEKLDKEQISRQHILELFSLISVALVIILFIVLFNRNRIKQQLKEVNVRNQLAADLHDEVGSSLSSILLLSKMANGRVNKENSNSMLEKISANTKEVIDKMGDIVWMMNPKYDEGENVREKIEQYLLRIKDIAPFLIQLKIDAAIDVMKFRMELRKTIFLIFKEALNNTLKYAGATKVLVQLKIVERNIVLIISDNGRGFNMETVSNGNGLDTMALRAKNCDGRFYINSAEGNGTEIKATIPIPHFRQKIL
jgi:signal transduction histidine kinase